MNEVMTGVIAEARKEGRRAGLLEAAKVCSDAYIGEDTSHQPVGGLFGGGSARFRSYDRDLATAIRALARGTGYEEDEAGEGSS
jgi:hypothetical protein